MSKLFKISSTIAICIIGIFLFGILYSVYSTTMSTTGTLKVSGLQSPVTINRDQHGVPHIDASNDEDAFFALGYIHAQDRLWQMEFQRHIAKGTLSEMFGEATVDQDKFLRTIGFYRSAQAAWDALDAKTKSLFHHYILGINSFLQNGKLPIEFKILNYTPEPWSDVDSIAWQKLMAWDLQSTWREKLENEFIAKQIGKDQISFLLPEYPSQSPTILSDTDLEKSGLISEVIKKKITLSGNIKSTESIENIGINKKNLFRDAPGKGSNNWVVSGRFTQNHLPILANDPHLGLASPMLWYLADIKTPNFHSIGATIPGLPVVVLGHNDYIAWGMTNGCVDAQDLYIESNTSHFTIYDEVIKIKGKKPIHFPVRVTSHGPIISDVMPTGKLNKLVALKWTALLPNDTTMQSFLKLSYAQNWNDFQNALADYIVPSQNFIYADIHNNIGYYLSGKIPIRSSWSGAFPIPSQKNLEWKDYIPFKQMPHVYNPPEGMIVSANNPVASNHYPYSLTFRCGIAPYRSQRILDLLKNQHNLTVETMKKIQNDTVSYLWKDLRTILLTTHPLDKESQYALDLLRKWDGDMNVNSESATIFAFWYKELNQLTPEKLKIFSEWSEPLFIKRQLETNGHYCVTNSTHDAASFLSVSLQHALSEIIKQQGHNTNQWKWGNVHRAIFEGLGLGSVPYLGWIWNRNISTPGDPYTVNVGTYDLKQFNQIEGAGYRQIIDLSKFNDSAYIQALGQSDHVLSRHYADQMPLWKKGQYLPMSSAKESWGGYSILHLVPMSS